MVKFQVETLLACDAAMYIADKDTPVYKKFHVRVGAQPRIPSPHPALGLRHVTSSFFVRRPREKRLADPTRRPSRPRPQMEKLGTLESEVLSHEVVDGRVKVVVRTVPGMKLPRVVRPVLRGKEVEFVDTRTFLQRDQGKLPFAQTFRTVNNITERASVAGTIVIDRAPVPVGPGGSSGRTMMGTVIRVRGECVVRIAGLGGKVEAVIVQNLKNAYGKLPDIVGEWMATRETRIALYEGFSGLDPGGIEPAPSLDAGHVSTTVSLSRTTSSEGVRAPTAEREDSGSDSAGSFHSADSFDSTSSRPGGADETREPARGWDGRAVGGAPTSDGPSDDAPTALSTPSFAVTEKPPLPRSRGADNPRRAGTTPVASGLTPHAFESDSPAETPESFRPRGLFEERRTGGEGSDADIDSADERRSRVGARPTRARDRRAPSTAPSGNVARVSAREPEFGENDPSTPPGWRDTRARRFRDEKSGGVSAVARWCCCAPGNLGSPLLDVAGAGASPASSDGSARSLPSSPGADDAAALAWSPADDADLLTPLTPGTKTKRRFRR